MLKVSPLQRPLRRIVPIAIIIVGLILISALVIQQVSAQESRTLKPPFKLIQPDRPNPLVNIQAPGGILSTSAAPCKAILGDVCLLAGS
jgi:amino acid transporter